MQRNLLVREVREEEDIVEFHLYFLLGLTCISLSGFICISCHRSTYPCRNILHLCCNSRRSAAPCHTPPPCSKCQCHSIRPLSRNNLPPSCSSNSPQTLGSTQWDSNSSPPRNNPRQPCLTSYAALTAGLAGATFKRILARLMPSCLGTIRNDLIKDAIRAVAMLLQLAQVNQRSWNLSAGKPLVRCKAG